MHTASALVLVSENGTRREIAQALAAGGLSVRCCESVAMFRAGLAGTGFDICVLARRLSDGDGLEMVRELRAANSDVGLVVVGERHDEVDAVLALEMGADDFLGAPDRTRELYARVRAVLRRIIDRAGTRAAPEMRLPSVEGFQIDALARLVTRADGIEADLTPLEFDVLVALVANANKVLSRAAITKAVYGGDKALNSRAIDGIVSRLRHKLFDGDEGIRRIRTVHGRGYMFLGASDVPGHDPR